MFINKSTTDDLNKKIIVSFLIKAKSGYTKLNCFLDTGSQLTIMQESILEILLSKSYINKNKLSYSGNISSYTNNVIPILYKIKLKAKINLTSDNIDLTFHIIPNLEFLVPKIILGADLIRLYKGEIKYDNPLVSFRTPSLTPITTYYISDVERFSGHICSVLHPKEIRPAKVILHKASPALANMSIFIEGLVQKTFEILPTTSKVLFDHISQELYATAMAQNFTKKPITLDFTLPFSINSKDIIPLREDNISFISKTYKNLLTPAHIYPDYQKRHKIIHIDDLPPAENSSESLHPHLFHIEHTEDININDPSPDNPDQDHDVLTPQGYQIEKELTPEELININDVEPCKRKYIKDIFITSFPEVLARHSLDRGHISDTLGYYHIRLKAGKSIPNQRRVFSLEKTQERHLADILSFMSKSNIIEKVPISKRNIIQHNGNPAFLVARQNPEASARLVIDYSATNASLEPEQSIIPNITTTLHSLRNYFLFTVIDVSNAYNSFEITEESKDLTKFSTVLGQYVFRTLPTGLSVSASVWGRIISKILGEKVERNDKGDIIRLGDGTAKMSPSPLDGVHHFFDDILISSVLKNNYTETLDNHFKKVKIVIERLNTHRVKINIAKAVFAKSCIKFLGHKISLNFICPDEKRINKLLDAKMPCTKKGVRSFLGLIQSFRNGLDQSIMQHLYTLTPLTSSSMPYKVEKRHIEAFEEIKLALTRAPIFQNILDPAAPKFLFTDASPGETGAYSAVLIQVAHQPTPKIPDLLVLDDPIDRYIYDKGLPYLPVPKLNKLESHTQLIRKLHQLQPPQAAYLELPNQGYRTEDLNNTLFISIQKIQSIHNCKILSTECMREGIIKTIKKTEIRLNLQTFLFKNDKFRFQAFTEDFAKGLCNIDEAFYCLDALSRFLGRHLVLLNGLDEHRVTTLDYSPQINYKPKFIIAVSRVKEQLIFRPYWEKLRQLLN